MNPLLFAKTGDVTSLQAAKDFATAYAKTLLERAASDRNGSVEAVYSETTSALETALMTNKTILKTLENAIHEVPAAPADRLPELTGIFYSELYRHFARFRSPSAFYRQSMAFLQQVTAAVIARIRKQLESSGSHLPEIGLFAIGPTGRAEYSPFCTLQILIVHGDATKAELGNIDLFCNNLHAGLEAAGMPVDPIVTPQNSRWRGTMAEWLQRFEEGLRPQSDEESIDLCRLADLYPLSSSSDLVQEFKEASSAALNSSTATVTNLIERMTALSNGLGIMGGLKLERSGNERGMFRLLDHGLLPFSVALSALSLIKKSSAIGSCERIHDLLRLRVLDVEMAERMLATWYTLHDLLLWRELHLNVQEASGSPLCLNPKEMSAEQLHLLKETLESVATIQRHVEIIFSGIGE